MLKPEGNIKIIDFGIAREYKEQSLADTTVLGTKGYAPPEQYSGQTDARSDIFALGMTLHHLLTGVDPRSGDAYAPVRMWNPELSEGIEIIIDKCVQPAAENRYQSCTDLLYDLEHPELITKDYKKRQKRKLTAFVLASALTIVLTLTGIICNISARQINNNNYETLVSPSSATSLEDKISSYKQAIEIYPDRIEAYTCMLEAYEDEGKFGKKENDEFLALYNAHKDNLDETSKEYAELNYKIGMMYFNYYTNDDGSYSFSNRVQKAYSFFAINFENKKISAEFEHKSLSDCYYRICYFYKKYILNSATVEEASRDNYDDLISIIDNELQGVKAEGAYDQLTLYNGTFMFLYDQRSSMVQVNVDENTVLGLMDTVYKNAKSLSVKKEQSQRLQKEILEHYDDYRQAIDRAYTNARERADLNAEKENE
jgi:serine/threonine-protein kinase